MVKHVGALEFAIEPCRTHWTSPSNQELLDAVEAWREQALDQCIACGQALDVDCYLAAHRHRSFAGERSHRWSIVRTSYRIPALLVQTGIELGAVHLACLRTAFPFASWRDKIEENVISKARLIEPWERA